MNKDLIYGKSDIENVVSIEVDCDKLCYFTEKDGVVETHHTDYPGQFLIFTKPLSNKMVELDGDQFYKYRINYTDLEKLKDVKQACYRKRRKFFTVAEPKENSMLQTGMTYYQGMNPADVSILSFDLETTSLTLGDASKILIISNTFRPAGSCKVIRKLFCYDDYTSEGAMILDWCMWVRDIDPSIMCGHNILYYDLPYLQYCANRADVGLPLGRDGSTMKTDKRLSKKRKDGSQEYEYHNAWIFGREIIDTFFLSLTYDVGRKYPSYKLEEIIEFEGLEVKGRQHYDASQIRHNYKIPEEWVKIKQYAEHDSDDALALFDLMIPSFFHYSKCIPKPFQQIINSASGSQVNSVMVRAYLQMGHSLPQASESDEGFEGAISFGNPGVYKKVYKVDVASLYPSIMRQWKVGDKEKDPMGFFYELVETFTIERLKNKKLHKETGDRIYKDLSDAQKIFINSMYGFMGAQGLLFNSPENAAFVTRKGREILQKGILWACGASMKQIQSPKDKDKKIWVQHWKDDCKGKGFSIVNADTDSFSYTAPKGYTEDEFKQDIDELNNLYEDLIIWEDDGFYKKVIVVKTKNYILDDGKRVSIKGGSLKATMKEPALKQMINDIIRAMLKDAPYTIPLIYKKYVDMVSDIETKNDMAQWASKKTITDSVLTGTDATAQKMRAALGKMYVQEGDKVFVFFKGDESLCLRENFDGDFSKKRLYEKVYKTLCVFDTLFNMKLLPDYSKVTHIKKLKEFENEIS